VNVCYLRQYLALLGNLVITVARNVTAEVDQAIAALMMADVQTENAAMAGLAVRTVRLVCTHSSLF